MDQDKKIPVACFAPSLTDEKLASYESLITGMGESETKDALLVLLRCVKAWWVLPESSRTDGDPFSIMHQGSLVQYKTKPLEPDQVKAIWDATPWMRELNTLSTPQDDGLLDSLAGEIRDVAFHLLWHCKEITLDREPLTSDKLSA